MKAKELIISKNKVVTIYSDITIKEALDILLKSNLSCIPVLERDSKRYLYSISAYGLLKKVSEAKQLSAVNDEPVSKVGVERLLVPCSIDTDARALVDLVVNQNFVPIVDEKGVFQGIVTRKAVINYLADLADRED